MIKSDKNRYCVVDIPNKFIESGYSLKHLGIIEEAWKINDAIRVIDFLARNEYIILGGDVYSIKGNEITPTYDSWYMDKSISSDLIKESKYKALDYLSNYNKKNGNSYIYTIVYKKK